MQLISTGAGLAWNVTAYSRLSLVALLGQAGVMVRPLRRIATRQDGTAVLQDVLTGAKESLDDVIQVAQHGSAS